MLNLRLASWSTEENFPIYSSATRCRRLKCNVQIEKITTVDRPEQSILYYFNICNSNLATWFLQPVR